MIALRKQNARHLSTSEQEKIQRSYGLSLKEIDILVWHMEKYAHKNLVEIKALLL